MLPWLILFILLISPVTVRLDIRLVHGAEAVIAPRVWGLGPQLRFSFQDHRPVRIDRKGRAHPLRITGNSTGAPPPQALHRAISLLTLTQLDVALCISLGDAAHTALTAGGLQSVWQALPIAWRRRARFQVRPDFLGGQGGVQARCMVFCHLGTLLYAALLLLISSRRPKIWNIPSVN